MTDHTPSPEGSEQDEAQARNDADADATNTDALPRDDDAGLDEAMPDVVVNDSVTPEHPIDQ